MHNIRKIKWLKLGNLTWHATIKILSYKNRKYFMQDAKKYLANISN